MNPTELFTKAQQEAQCASVAFNTVDHRTLTAQEAITIRDHLIRATSAMAALTSNLCGNRQPKTGE